MQTPPFLQGLGEQETKPVEKISVNRKNYKLLTCSFLFLNKKGRMNIP